jgi:hypothetical protein
VRIHPRDFLLVDALRQAKGWEKVLQHVEGCSKCRERAFLLKSIVSRYGKTEAPDYGPVIERSFRTFEALTAVLGRERSAAPGLLARLIVLSSGQQQLFIRNRVVRSKEASTGRSLNGKLMINEAILA